MITTGSTFGKQYTDTADVVVVGSGAGGAPMAYQLASAGLKVILLEAGEAVQTEDLNKDVWKSTEKLWLDKAASFTVGTPPIVLPLGRNLGGTTTINSGTCFHLPEKTFSNWKRSAGLTGFEYADLVPYFNLLDQYLNVTEVPYELMGANNQLFAEGATKLGLSPKPLRRNQRNCQGSGICVFGCPRGAKQSMDKSFLPDASKAGAQIITGATVSHISTENGKATGVSGFFGKNKDNSTGIFAIKAAKVVISCGAIYTPSLLLKNKIANSSGLVGKNLRIHPVSKVLAFFDKPIYAWRGVPQALYVDDYAHEGIMFEGFFLPPAFLSVAIPATGLKLKEYMAKYNQMAGFGIMVSDSSHGRVRLGWGGGTPLMTYNLNTEDTQKFIKGIEIAAKVYLAAGANQVLLPIHGIPPIIQEQDLAILKTARISAADLEISAFHPLGTCQLGDNPRKSVVNNLLQTHDIQNLYIVDASVFPTGLGVNPQITIMAFSLRAADHIVSTFSKNL